MSALRITEQDRAVAVVTMFGEARGESDVGLRAVAAVILNRASNPRWWGKTVTEVCRRPALFSCWNADDPQSARLRGVLTTNGVLTAEAAMNPQIERARRAWAAIETGEMSDPTSGCTHYLTPEAYDRHQRAGRRSGSSWSFRARPTATIGGHMFFRPQDIGEIGITPWAPRPAAAPEKPASEPSRGLFGWIFDLVLARLGIKDRLE